MMKIADSLRLCAPAVRPRSRKWRDVSGSEHPHDENCRQSQALSRFPHATPENGGASQAACMQMMKLPTVSGSEQFFCAHHSRKWRDVSGGLRARDENCRQSQAPSTRAHVDIFSEPKCRFGNFGSEISVRKSRFGKKSRFGNFGSEIAVRKFRFGNSRFGNFRTDISEPVFISEPTFPNRFFAM